MQGRRDDFESGGPDINIKKVGTYPPKKRGAANYMFRPISTKKCGDPGPLGQYLTTLLVCDYN